MMKKNRCGFVVSTLVVITATLASSAQAQSWERRWRHGESKMSWGDFDLTAISIQLTDDLVLVSEPYVPSHCDPQEHVYDGSVTAFDRKTGEPRWHETIRQTSQDQTSYLDVYAIDEMVTCATWSNMRALDLAGHVVWSREVTHGDECANGPTAGFHGRLVTQFGHWLAWLDDGAICGLDLKTGEVRRERWDTADEPSILELGDAVRRWSGRDLQLVDSTTTTAEGHHELDDHTYQLAAISDDRQRIEVRLQGGCFVEPDEPCQVWIIGTVIAETGAMAKECEQVIEFYIEVCDGDDQMREYLTRGFESLPAEVCAELLEEFPQKWDTLPPNERELWRSYMCDPLLKEMEREK